MTCKDCIYFKRCVVLGVELDMHHNKEADENCRHFKNKADYVEVVRCKDCKHAYFKYNTKDTLQEIYACKKRPVGRAHKKVSGSFFCKHGEKK